MKDAIDKAVKQAGGALNLFVQAHGELEGANAKLDGAIAAHTETIEHLQDRVAFAKEQAEANSKAKAKLAEFIA